MWILETFKLIPTVVILIISIISVNYVSCAFVKMNGYFFEKTNSKKIANVLFILALTLGTAEIFVDLIRLVTWNETLVLMKALLLTTNNWIIIVGSLILLVLSINESYQGSNGAIALSIGLSICLITFFVSQTTELLISHWGVIALSAAMAVVLSNRYKVSQQKSKWDTETLKLRNKEMEMLYLDIDYAQTELLLRLGSIFDVRSHESSAHVHRVAEYTKLISLKLELPESDIELISKASTLHDIGKVGTPDAILNAPGRLSKVDFDEMKCHARVGFEILNGSMVEILDLAAVISLTHHERYDGKGYPDGLVGDEIPIQGAIVAAADVFDALLSTRVYKEAWTLDDVIQYFEAESGKHFNPQIAQIIIDYRSEFEAIINTLPYET
jgi:HD-GYP domain-containing protein (c-di-GMP phosphodiesterase class II)